MTTFAVSFSISYDQSYATRYDSFMTEIRRYGRVWAETTSFCLVETQENIQDFERRLYLSAFAPSSDKMLVLDVRFNSAIARGHIADPTLLSGLLPLCEIKSLSALV